MTSRAGNFNKKCYMKAYMNTRRKNIANNLETSLSNETNIPPIIDETPQKMARIENLCFPIPNRISANDVVTEKFSNFVSEPNNTENIESFLSNWAKKFSVTHTALNELLKYLNSTAFPNLPIDARTLLGTCRVVDTKKIEGGEYFNFGIKHSMEDLLLKCNSYNEIIENNNILLDINIDGLPISKSSSSQLYPILCKLHKTNIVSMIGVYHGYEKPGIVNEFLQDFVSDSVDLINNGLEIQNKKYTVRINSIICDVPAKAFVTCTKGHSGYNSCSKCFTEGYYIDNRTCFPQIQNIRLRTDNDFRMKTQDSHHTGTSCLEDIPHFDMVKNIPLDYMHLICLGVMKKLLLNLWCCGKPPNKLSYQAITNISNSLTGLSNCIPLEFSRKPRSLTELKRWKATEFRQFLFYTGPIALLNNTNADCYKHFLSLHVACTILSQSQSLSDSLDYAEELLVYFVTTFKVLYGAKNMSHNIHNLLHLVDDVRTFGVLDNFSAFPFENFLHSLLKSLRKNEKPLAQIVKRQSEYHKSISTEEQSFYPQLLMEHTDGPLLPDCDLPVQQFKKVVFQNFILKCKSYADSCFLLKDNSIVMIENVIKHENNCKFIGKMFLNKTNFYEKPCPSSELGIFIVSEMGRLDVFGLDTIARKLLKLKHKDKFVVIPLLHS